MEPLVLYLLFIWKQWWGGFEYLCINISKHLCCLNKALRLTAAWWVKLDIIHIRMYSLYSVPVHYLCHTDKQTNRNHHAHTQPHTHTHKYTHSHKHTRIHTHAHIYAPYSRRYHMVISKASVLCRVSYPKTLNISEGDKLIIPLSMSSSLLLLLLLLLFCCWCCSDMLRLRYKWK